MIWTVVAPMTLWNSNHFDTTGYINPQTAYVSICLCSLLPSVILSALRQHVNKEKSVYRCIKGPVEYRILGLRSAKSDGVCALHANHRVRTTVLYYYILKPSFNPSFDLNNIYGSAFK